MINLKDIQEAITRENLGGWLFFNFHHRDELADRFLGISPENMNSRYWFYFIPADGVPVRICHAIEKRALEALPGNIRFYSSQEELEMLLRPLACVCGAAFSETLAPLSYMDYGMGLKLASWGFDLRPAERLIQETMGVLSPAQMDAHEEAAAHLYEIVGILWDRIGKAFYEGRVLREIEVQRWILDEFEARNLVTAHSPIVAVGPNAADPHYEPVAPSAPLEREKVILFDLWAKKADGDGIFADISWAGFLGAQAPEQIARDFDLLMAARDRAVEVIDEALSEGREISGAQVDREVRQVITDGGRGDFLCHRTGHGIDAEVHGWGVNLDCIEFPDHRPVCEGACFSVEPGIYLEEYGFRTEIDCYIRDGKIRISGGPVQRELLLLK